MRIKQHKADHISCYHGQGRHDNACYIDGSHGGNFDSQDKLHRTTASQVFPGSRTGRAGKTLVSCFLALIISHCATAQLLTQVSEFTRADSLRGMLTESRSCYDVLYYDLNIKVDPERRFVEGSNVIHFLVTANFTRLQFDLFENMDVHFVLFENDTLAFEREYNAVFVTFNKELLKDELNKIKVYYSGYPISAQNPPWDGGFIWEMDQDSNHWVGVACEGIGASIWWPNKDHLSDEPDSMMIRVSVPPGLMNVSNGRLREVIAQENGWNRYDWFVSYPINNYNVTVNIGKYQHFSDVYLSGNDSLTLDYYVMPYNYEKAVEHFKQVKPMMACFEHYFGRFPFWDDGYKLVETSYLGMEHQSAIAYGNEYKTGYAGMDYSRIGLDFDYIIIHETGHEWWGNSVSSADLADLWIHEGFCTYSEALYVECMHGYDTALDYVNAKKRSVSNKDPIVGFYNVNKEGSRDMYNKGMLTLNTLRHVIDNDELWFDLIKSIAEDFKYQTTSTNEIVAYINKFTEQDLTYFFSQYLWYPSIPVFEYMLSKKRNKRILQYRWQADVDDFRMPVKVTTSTDKFEFVYPTTAFQETTLKLSKKDVFRVAEHLFYIEVEERK